MMLYLDVKIGGDLTANAEDYAKAISTRWEAAGLSNRLYVEGPSPESLAAYRSAFTMNYVPVLSYPAFSVSENFTWTALKARPAGLPNYSCAALYRRLVKRKPGQWPAQRR